MKYKAYFEAKPEEVSVQSLPKLDSITVTYSAMESAGQDWVRYRVKLE